MTDSQLEEIWARTREHFAQRPDVDMAAHAQAVISWIRRLIANGEPGDESMAVAAAILHDVGIPQAIRKYQQKGSPWHEVEGAVIARDILTEMGLSPATIEAISGIVGIHHQRPMHPTPEFRLVHDADILVNAEEAGVPLAGVKPQLYASPPD